MSRPSEVRAGSTVADRYSLLWEQGDDPPDLRRFLAEHRGLDARDRTDVLLVDQQFRWRTGHPLRAEEYLADWPDVAGDPLLRLDVVYGEHRATVQRGEVPDVEAFIARFPDLERGLRRQIEVAGWLHQPRSNPADTRVAESVPMAASTGQLPTETSQADPRAPLDVGDFELEEKIGAGAMGVVYRGRQKSLNKPVAVKLLKHVAAGNPEMVERFLREARAVASLRHPRIVGVHGIGRTAEGSYFLVMDLVEGIGLDQLLQDGPLPVDRAVQIVTDVAEAIDHANARGVIHRDLKPSNILLDAAGHVMVTDFGLAKMYEGEEAISADGQIIGTPEYMAPEQASVGRGEITAATDVYGLGALLYALLAGRPPIHGKNMIDVIAKVVSEQAPEPLRNLRPDVPERLEAICLRCLSKDPADRYGDARRLIEVLGRDEPIRVSGRQQRGDEPTPAGDAGRRWAIVGLVAAVFLAVGIGVRQWGPSGGDDQNNASHSAVRAVDVDWEVELYAQGRRDRRVVLPDEPRPLVNGDQLRIRLEFSEPVHAYLFWVDSDGAVESLYPDQASNDEPVRSVTVPPPGAPPGGGFRVRGRTGTEVCVLLLRESALEDRSGVAERLRPGGPLPPLEAHTVLLDGVPIRRPPPDSPPDEQTRDLGPPEPLVGSAALETFDAWHARLGDDLGDIRYLAIPHR